MAKKPVNAKKKTSGKEKASGKKKPQAAKKKGGQGTKKKKGQAKKPPSGGKRSGGSPGVLCLSDPEQAMYLLKLAVSEQFRSEMLKNPKKALTDVGITVPPRVKLAKPKALMPQSQALAYLWILGVAEPEEMRIAFDKTVLPNYDPIGCKPERVV